ncbi:MAG: glycosyltransferase, partial [Actinomycetota bacterium]|nr:glycosyltransferase [Actinomycetota bacterium]
MPPALTCLLPVRNAALDLPGWLESAARFADRVIALDDGSTDLTASLLQADPLVTEVLANPRRDSFQGWDDAANRQRLLDAAIGSGGGWVLFLDADERLDAEDAAALRDFVHGDAIAGCAYGIQMFRAWGDAVGDEPTYVYRLFLAAEGQRLPGQTLHFNPVPVSIPNSMWIRTTIRARHLESVERLEARKRKYAQSDPDSQWDPAKTTPLARPSQLVPWTPRSKGIPLLAVGAEGERAARAAAKPAPITCLVPVRNGEADLPGWLESVALFADRVIALDDGSTDGTCAVLESSPMVGEILRNPRRTSYAEWDDARNRQRLLDAAIARGGGWVFFLDADERIDPEDAEALRSFAGGGADPASAYGFRVFRMVGDEDHYDRARLWVYRMFHARAGQTLPTDALHFVPVPTQIPRDRWIKTTIRIKHLASLTEEHRRRRVSKYEEADPERRWQSDYSSLADADTAVLAWAPRPAGMPVLADPAGRGAGGELDLAELAPDAPLLSAVIISRNNADTIEATVRSVVSQTCDAPYEVILAASGDDGTADLVRARFPEVTVVDVPEPGLPGAARNAGVAAARGEIVSFPGSHVELPPGSLQARMNAHATGATMVTGSILNGQRTASGWAAYFLDHSSALPARPSGDLAWPPAHCSYLRDALSEVGGFPEDMRAGEDTVVNRALWARGHRAYRAQDIVLTHRNRCSNPLRLARHHFTRGRALGRIVLAERPRRAAIVYVRGYRGRRLRFTSENVERWGGELRAEYRRVRPLVRLG